MNLRTLPKSPTEEHRLPVYVLSCRGTLIRISRHTDALKTYAQKLFHTRELGYEISEGSIDIDDWCEPTSSRTLPVTGRTIQTTDLIVEWE